MNVTVKIEPYSRENGIRLTCEPGYEITCSKDHDSFLIKANAAGLRSLANLCLTLAQDAAPQYSHVHLDEYSALESGSVELVIVKV